MRKIVFIGILMISLYVKMKKCTYKSAFFKFL